MNNPGIKESVLLIGVTGGIASGKSTVANMLHELGAQIIDFDVLARQVVEPGAPAWNDIVSYFGRQVLNEDNTLDRKTLSDIVFRNKEKRKKLESYTHPRINEAYRTKVSSITKGHSNAIIQVVIPLLIEENLRDEVHKVLLVHVPREVQIERLMARDNITKDAAARILEAQLPIDEKIGYADFIIHNERSLDDTRLQVKRLWKEIKNLQKEKRTLTA